MSAAQARMLLRLLVAAGAPHADVRNAFHALGAPGVAAELLDGRLVVTTRPG
jgi:hypothetical protein